MNTFALLDHLDRLGFAAMQYLLSALWQSSLLFAATFALAWFLRKRRASVRHLIWVAALLVAPLLPVLTSGMRHAGAPQAPVSVLPAYAVSAPAPRMEPLPEPPPSPVVLTPSVPAHREIESHPVMPAPRSHPWVWCLVSYAVGLTFLFAWIVAGRLRVRHWIRSARPAACERVLSVFRAALEGTQPASRRAPIPFLSPLSGVEVLEGPGVPAPISTGILHPRVLLPIGLADRLSDEELRAVGLHEIAHLRRRDPLVLTLAAFVRAVLFFHPLVWLAARRISALAEQCADDAVLEATGQAVPYARLLARLAEELPRRPFSTEMATGLLLGKGAFLQRVEAILSGRRHRLSRLALVVTLIAVLVSLVIALAVPLGEKKDKDSKSASSEKIEWGKPVEGAQGRFVPDKTRILLGEPIFLTFTVRNTGDKPFSMEEHNASENVRPDGYRITAVDSRGRPVREADVPPTMGGIFGIAPIAPGQSFRKRLFLPQWCEFTEAGTYTVTCRVTQPLYKSGTEFTPGAQTVSLATATSFTLTILPADKIAMGRLIEELGQKVTASDKTAAEEAVRTLAAIRDERVAPHLVRAVRARCNMATAVEGLSRYPTSQSVAAVKEALHFQGDSFVQSMAAAALKRMKARDAAPDLVEVLNGQGSEWLRRDAVTALGEIGGAEATEALRKRLEDPSMPVRLAVVESLLKLGEPFHAEWVAPIVRSKSGNEFQNAIWFVRRNAGAQAAAILIGCLDVSDPSVKSYYNYTLTWQIGACGGPKLTYHHDFDGRGTTEQVEENRKTLEAFQTWLRDHPGGGAGTQSADRETSSTAAYDRSETLQSKTAPRLRYEVVANKAGIPLGGGAFVTAQLTNEGSEPVTVYWGDYAYDDQYVFQVTRPDGTDMKPSPALGRLTPPLDALNAARFQTVAPGGALKYEMVLTPLQAKNCQRFFFRNPGDYLVQASFAAIAYESTGTANEGQAKLRETWRGTIKSPPFHLKVSETPDEAHAGQFGSITIQGRVTDRSGKPVEGAGVEVSGAIPEAGSGREGWSGMPSPTSLDCRYTDKEGNFVLPRLPDAVAQFEIMSAHPAYPATKTTVVNVPPKKEFRADLAMKRGVTIRGVVRDDSGKPISGARVMSYQRRIEEPTTYTDTSGRFELPGVAIYEDGMVRADFWKKGYDSPRDAKTSSKEAESGNWTITMKNMGDLSFGGRAVFADGSAVASADIYFYLKDEGSERRMKTDAEGRFRGELPGAGPYSGWAWIVDSHHESIERGSRFLSSPHRWRAAVQNVAPGQENIELVFENRGRLEVLLASGKKKPVSGKFEVSCRYSYPGEQWPGVYREDIACVVLPSEGGTALFEKLAPGRYDIRVIDPQGPSWEKWTKTVTLLDGKLDARISMNLEAEAKLAGGLKARLVPPSGQNLPATVKAGMRAPGGEWINLEVRGGLIEAETLPAGENSLNVLCDGFLPVDRAVVIRAGETADLGEIALVSEETVAGWVEGRVLYHDGSPALGATVEGETHAPLQVSADGSYRQQLRAGHAMVGVQLAGAARWPRSDMPTGGVFIDGGPQNLARLWDDTIHAPVEVKAAETVHRDIAIPLNEFGKVRVEWLGDPNTPYGFYSLIVRRGDCFFACRTPNSNSAISQQTKDPIENVPCGERTAILRTMGYCGYQEAKPGETDSVFRFDPAQAGSITGKVAPRVNGAGSEGQRVKLEIYHGLFLNMGYVRTPSGTTIFSPTGTVGFSKVGADGSFRFPKVGAGKYLARIEGDDSGRVIPVEVKPGAESVADFTAAPKASSDPPTSQTAATTGSAPVRGSLSETVTALPETAEVESRGLKFEAGFIPEKTEIMVGEAIYVTLFVKNTGAESIFLETGGDGRSVRSYRFQFSATDEQGNPARDPNPNPSHFGGLQGAPPEIQPGKIYSEKLELAKWIAFDRPGQYTVRCARTLQFPKKQDFTRDYALVHPLATSFRLKVVDRTDPGATARIETLGTRLRAEEDENEARLTARLLADTGDKRIVPHLLWAAQKWSGDSWALRDLAAFKADPRVIALYHEALRKSRGNSRRSDAARLMGQSGNQDFVPDLLQAFAEEDDKFVLASVAAALGQFGDKQAAPILKKHRDHDYSHLRLEVEQALVRCGEPLDVERFQAIIRSTDPTWYSAAYFISRNAGGAAPRILAECLDFDHPEADVGQNNADANPAWRNGMLLMDIAQAGGPRFDYNRIHNRPATPEETEANRQTLRKVQEWLAAQAGAKAVSETDEASAVSVAGLTAAPKASDPPTTAAADARSEPERLVARSAPGVPWEESRRAFDEILKLRETRDAKYVPALEKILEANFASGRIHDFAAAQALFCIGTPEARAVLDHYLLTPRYETWRGIDCTTLWKMTDPQRSDFIKQYYLKNLSQDLVVELAAEPRQFESGAQIEFILNLRNASNKTFRIQEPQGGLGRMLFFQDQAGRIGPPFERSRHSQSASKQIQLALAPGTIHQYAIMAKVVRTADWQHQFSSNSDLFASAGNIAFEIGREGRFQVFAMVEAQAPTKAQLEKSDFNNPWIGRAVSKPIEVDLSWAPPVPRVGNPAQSKLSASEPPQNALSSASVTDTKSSSTLDGVGNVPVVPAGEERKKTVFGVVKDAKGQPLEGAKVILAPVMGGGSRVLATAMDAATRVAEPCAIAKTAHDGAFVLDLPDEPTTVSWRLLASKPGYACDGTNLMELDRVSERNPFDFVLAEPGRLTGQVVNTKGEPVSGALVYPSANQPSLLGEAAHEIHIDPALKEFASRTDASGRFRLEQIPSDWQADPPYLSITHPGYVNLRVSAYSDDPVIEKRSDGYRVVLTPGGRIRGRVFDPANNRPAAGFRIHSISRFWRSVMTDAEGRYEFTNMAPGEYWLGPYVPSRMDAGSGFLEGIVTPRSSVILEEGQTLEGVDLVMHPGVLVQGRVIAKETLKGVPGTFVTGKQRKPDGKGLSWKDAVETDAEGRFRILAPEGEVLLWARSWEYGGASPEQSLALRMGQTPPEVAFTLQKLLPDPLVVRGVVLDPEGKPAAGVMVGSLGSWDSSLTRTNEAGRFTLRPSLAPDQPLAIQAHAQERNLSALLVPGGVEVDLTIRLQPCGAIGGRLVDQDKRPITGAKATVSEKAHERLGAMTVATGVSDSKGRFLVSGLCGGTSHSLKVVADGYADRAAVRVKSVAGQEVDCGDIVLERATLYVDVAVVDASGAPVESAIVRVGGMDSLLQRSATDSKGKARLGPFGAGRIHLSVRKPGFRGESRRLTLTKDGNRECALTLTKAPPAPSAHSDPMADEPEDDEEGEMQPLPAAGNPVEIEVGEAPPGGPAAGPRANAGFEKLSVEMRLFWWGGIGREIQIAPTGRVRYAQYRGNERDKALYESEFDLSDARLAGLTRILEKTDWFQLPPDKAGAVDVVEFKATLTKDGSPRSVEFMVQGMPPYSELEAFLYAIEAQEYLRNRISGPAGRERLEAARTIKNDLLRLMEDPPRTSVAPGILIDFARFAPVMTPWLDKAKESEYQEEERSAAATLTDYLKRQSARPKTDFSQDVEGGITCALSLPKNAFQVGDKLVAKLVFENHTKGIRTICIMPDEEMGLRFEDETGRLLKDAQVWGGGMFNVATMYHRIDPGGSYSVELEARFSYLRNREGQTDGIVQLEGGGWRQRLEKPGNYRVYYNYVFWPTRTYRPEYPVWEKEIESNKVEFSVSDVTSPRAEEWLSLLAGPGGYADKREAFEALQAVRPAKSVADILGALDKGIKGLKPNQQWELLRIMDRLYRTEKEKEDFAKFLVNLLDAAEVSPGSKIFVCEWLARSGDDVFVQWLNRYVSELKPEEIIGNETLRPLLDRVYLLPPDGKRALTVPLLQVMKDAPEHLTRNKAGQYLKAIADPSIIPELVKTLKDPRNRARVAAANVLGAYAGPDVLPALEAMRDATKDKYLIRNAKAAIEAIKQRQNKTSVRSKTEMPSPAAGNPAEIEVGIPAEAPSAPVRADSGEEALGLRLRVEIGCKIG